MKRARQKKSSFFFGKKSAKPEIDFHHENDDYISPEEEIIEDDFPAVDAEQEAEAEKFAVPDDAFIEDEAESFAVTESEPEDIPEEEEELPIWNIGGNNNTPDSDDDSVSDEEPDESEDEEPNDDEAPSYDDIPDEEVPFSTEDYTTDEVPEVEPEPEERTPSEDFLNRREQNRKKWEAKRRRKRITTVTIASILAALAIFFIVMGIDFSGTPHDGFLTPVDTATGKINILLLGVDKDGERSDSIMLASYDFDNKTVNLMSVPRDTRMYVVDRKVTRKITEVHGMHDSSNKMYGAAAVAESVTALTGIPINYYVEFSFSAIDNIMDILGPVTFDVPDIEGNGRGMNYDDDFQDLHIHLKPGLQELSGNQIQQFLRYRKSNYGTSDGSDISRVGRQHELLKAIIDQKVNISLIIKIPDIFKELKSQLKTNFTAKDILKYAGYLKDLSSDNIVSHVLPGEDSNRGGAWYYICDFDKTAELVSTNFGYEVSADELTNEISLTGKKPVGKTPSSGNNSNNSNKSDKYDGTLSEEDDDPISAPTSDPSDDESEEENGDDEETTDTDSSSESSNSSSSNSSSGSGNSSSSSNSSGSGSSSGSSSSDSSDNSSDSNSSSDEDDVISLD